MAKELPKRSEVKIENTWKVEDMYANLDAWKADIEKVKELTEKLTAYQGKMGESAENLYQAMFLDDEISRIGGMAYSYASRCSDVDTTNTENQSLVMQVSKQWALMLVQYYLQAFQLSAHSWVLLLALVQV